MRTKLALKCSRCRCWLPFDLFIVYHSLPSYGFSSSEADSDYVTDAI
jgi:hypothetical protein